MRVKLSTGLGEVECQLDIENAPVTAAYFATLIRKGALDSTEFFRIVSTQSSSSLNANPIEVLQAGIWEPSSQGLEMIEFESTKQTGLPHKKWSLSTARYDVGTVYGSFFICMRDEPALDYGGLRHPDGNGFANFGSVTSGFSVLEQIYASREKEEFQAQAVSIKHVTFVD